MTIRHLKIFIVVHDEKNMTTAASRLYMTQPSVSQAIRELENFYGVSLFERLSRKLFVTEFGEKVYQYATSIVNLFDELESTIKEESIKIKLRIGANYTVGAVLIHKYIEQFKVFYPEAEVRVVVNKASELLHMLHDNRLDFALMEEVRGEVDVHQECFCEDRIAVVASPTHPIFHKKKVEAADLVREHLLLREKGAGVRNLFEMEMNQLGFSIVPFWESTSTTALIKAAENKIGIAVLPVQLIKEQLREGALREIKLEEMDFNRQLMIVYHKNKILSDAMLEFMKFCKMEE